MTEAIEIKTPDICEFIRGERDCKEHKERDVSAGEDYQQGYGFQYAMAEMQSEGVV